MRLRLFESSITSRFKVSPKIRTDATFDFCNSITPKADIAGSASVPLSARSGPQVSSNPHEDLNLIARRRHRARVATVPKRSPLGTDRVIAAKYIRVTIRKLLERRWHDSKRLVR